MENKARHEHRNKITPFRTKNEINQAYNAYENCKNWVKNNLPPSKKDREKPNGISKDEYIKKIYAEKQN